jgi:hypothetical protein
MAFPSMRSFRIVLLLFCDIWIVDAQPTSNVLARTLRVQSQYGTGTMFSIEVDGREYWVTATHILTGAKGKPYGRVAEKTVELKILNPGGSGRQWLPVTFAVLQPAEDVDVAALAATKPLFRNETTTTSPPATSDGLVLGGPCEFLGFALDGGWRLKMPEGSFWVPFVKHCTVSAFDIDSHMFILDGINNPGFSGGPVIIGTGLDVKFAAVISGYYLEPTEVIRGRPATLAHNAPRDIVNVNSGFIIAYDIVHAVQAIKKNPIGPVHQTK